MPDVHCNKCGEPWETYSLRNEVPDWDGEPDDAYDRFMNGEGCPTCDWGEKEGEVSLSRTEDSAETEARHLKDKLRNTDEDPLKFF